MTGWASLLIDILKLTDEVKRLNQTTGDLKKQADDMDRRIVRLETMVEMARYPRRIESGPKG